MNHKSLNILILTNRIPFPLNDGGNIAIYYMVKFLTERGHQVQMLSFNTKKHYQEVGVLDGICQLEAVELDNSVSLVGILKGVFQSQPYYIQRFDSGEYREKLTELLQSEKFDIVQTETIYMGMFAEQVKKESMAKLVLRAHNIENLIWSRLSQNSINPIKKIYYKYLSKRIKSFEESQAKLYDRVIPITETDAAFYKSFLNEQKVTSIPAGIDFCNYTKYHKKSKKNTICFLGSLEWQPNIEGLQWFLKSVWTKLIKLNKSVQFHIAGKNPPQFLLDIKQERVKMHGMVKDAMEFLSNYEILVVPLLSGSGMRLKVIEAMAVKKCIVSTSIGAEGIAVGKDELVLVDDANKMAFMINELLQNESKRMRLRENAFSFVQKHYDWNNLIAQFEAAYQ